MKKIALFILLCCAWGFALGTLALLGPVRWLVTYARKNNLTENHERFLVLLCIVILAVLSFWIAYSSTNSIIASTNRSRIFLFIAVPLLGACAAVAAFMNPKLMNAGSTEEMVSKNFTIGAYPDRDKLNELKEHGYTAVISLLHPAIVPFEPKLIADEKQIAKEVGIDLIQIPMLPWIVDNVLAIDSLKQIVAEGKGKYYIHCYLGKDRVNVARRVIEEAHEKVVLENNQFLNRNLDSIHRFERGSIVKLDEQVYFIPMPTKEEYFGYLLTGKIHQIVSLTDTADPAAKKLTLQEQKNLNALHINFKVYHVNETTASGAFLKMSNEIKQMPHPLIIHSFFSDSKEAKSFLEAYQKNNY